jgi:2-hydroxychromene-2-carboxylate isomerase
MAAPLDFYFDFSSPYGYFAAHRIDDIAARHGRDVIWRPILLGVVFKVTGGAPLPTLPLKGDYAARDVTRSARYFGVPIHPPSKFPISSQAPSRAVYWAQDRDPALGKRLALALYDAYFQQDRDISSPQVTADVAAEVGLDREAVLAALNDPVVKDRVRSETDAAISRGVFGSPFVIVDGEPFWGADRLEQIEKWLATGGW